MVAMTLGLIIIGASVQVFQANKQNFRFTSALARMQEDGRYAIAAMSRDIRMAGYAGCSSRQQIDVNVVAAGSPPAVDLGANSITGIDNGTGWWTLPNPPQDHTGTDLTICDSVGGGNAICQVSDVIQIVRGSETAAALTTTMTSFGASLRIRPADYNNFDPAVTVSGAAPSNEDLVLVTDCRRADLFRTTAIGTTSGDQTLTPNANLQQTYQAGAIVTPLSSSAYFIADDNADDDGDGNPDPVAALYRIGAIDGGAAPAALPIAKGVEMMVVTYGIDTAGDEFADSYVASAAVPDWGRVVSVRISLLLKSREDFLTDYPIPVTFVDGTVVNTGAGADRRLRLVFSTTVTLRNRVP